MTTATTVRDRYARVSNIMRTIFVDTRVLEPCKFPQLPMGSQHVDPNGSVARLDHCRLLRCRAGGLPVARHRQ